MKGFIEIREDSYEDTLEHLHKIKQLACKIMKALAHDSEMYDRDPYDDDEEYEARGRRMRGGRYKY